jgi:hypothetical protein
MPRGIPDNGIEVRQRGDTENRHCIFYLTTSGFFGLVHQPEAFK